MAGNDYPPRPPAARRAARAELRREILRVLAESWDPLLVAGTPDVERKYGGYVNPLRRLLQEGAPEAALADFLWKAGQAIAVPADRAEPLTPPGREDCRLAARRLRLLRANEESGGGTVPGCAAGSVGAVFPGPPCHTGTPGQPMTPPPRLPLRNNPAFKFAVGLLLVLVLPFTILGTIRLVDAVREAARSASWPGVEGRVEGTALEESSSTDRFGVTTSQYSVQVGYRYEVGGVTYRSHRVGIIPRRDSNRARVEAELRAYPVGGLVRVFHDPDAPGRALLRPGMEWGLTAALSLVNLGMLVGCGLGLRFLFLPARRP